MAISTQVCNATTRAVKLQVGSARYASDVATIAAGGKHAIAVDFNATYREYIIGVADTPGLEKIVVSSDDLCDCKCITIKEGPNGTLTVEKEPRQSDTATSADGSISQTPKKAKWIPAWLSRSEK
jgi:hypothetical protein